MRRQMRRQIGRQMGKVRAGAGNHARYQNTGRVFDFGISYKNDINKISIKYKSIFKVLTKTIDIDIMKT